MSRVSAEITVTAAQSSKPKSAKPEPSSASDNFSALIDGSASAAVGTERGKPALPNAVAPQRPTPDDRDVRSDHASRTGKDPATTKDSPAPASETDVRDHNTAADTAKSGEPASPEAKSANGDKDKSGGDDAKASDADADATASTDAPAAVVANPAVTLAAILVVADASTGTKANPASGGAEAAPETGAAEAIEAAASATVSTALSTTAKETSPNAGIAAPAVAKAKTATTDGAVSVGEAQTSPTTSSLPGDDTGLNLNPVKTSATPDADAAAAKAPSAETVAPSAAKPEHHATGATIQSPLLTNDLAQPVLTTNQQPLQANPSQPLPAAQVSVAFAGNAPVPLSGLAVDIALRAASGKSSFDIRLDPAELGRIDVRLDVDKHGQVTSHLTVEKPATLDMLRRDAPQLQRALEDAGLKTSDGGLQFSLRDQSSSGRQDDGQSGRQSQRLIISDEDTSLAPIAGKSYGRMLAASRGVDISI